MTPAQMAADILATVPRTIPCCAGTQPVEVKTLESLRDAVQNAVVEEELVHRILARCRPVIRAHVVRMQAEADGAAALQGKPNATSEEWLQSARELAMSVDARLGVLND